MNEASAIGNTQPKVAAIYLRVSTLDQKNGMESQLRTLKEFCEKNKIVDYQIFSDEGISGSKSNRPGLDRLMAFVREGRADRVLVYSFSRFARSVTHLLNALEEFRKLNVPFISYTESVDTNSPMGRAFFVVIAAISQLERELIVDRVKNGLRNARAKGKQLGRKKTRPSDLIRALVKKGLPYRSIASICNTSHGSVSAEIRAMRREEEEAKLKAAHVIVPAAMPSGEFFPDVKVDLPAEIELKQAA